MLLAAALALCVANAPRNLVQPQVDASHDYRMCSGARSTALLV